MEAPVPSSRSLARTPSCVPFHRPEWASDSINYIMRRDFLIAFPPDTAACNECVTPHVCRSLREFTDANARRRRLEALIIILIIISAPPRSGRSVRIRSDVRASKERNVTSSAI